LKVLERLTARSASLSAVVEEPEPAINVSWRPCIGDKKKNLIFAAVDGTRNKMVEACERRPLVVVG
jgi:hypothetical protein